MLTLLFDRLTVNVPLVVASHTLNSCHAALLALTPTGASCWSTRS